MYTIEGKIKFVSDVLFNNLTSGSLKDLESGQRGKKKTADDKIAEVPEKLHRNAKGEAIIVGDEMFKQSLIAGCKAAGLKVGKKQLWPIMNAVCFPEDLSFKRKDFDYIHEHWGRIPPKTGQLAILRRPAFRAGIELALKMTIVDDTIEPDQIKIAIEHAGLFIGVASWRPKYGRFTLVEFHVKH